VPTIDFLRLTVSAVEAPKVTQIFLSEVTIVNLNDRSPVTQLEITVSVFRLNYAFRLIVEGLMVCTFSTGFFLYELPFRSYKAFK